MNILDYWWVLDFLADENVENWGSILIGFLAVSPIYILLHWIPFGLFLLRPKWYVWAIPLAMLILACGILGGYIAFRVHDIWNMYQAWYITPQGAPIG